MHVLAAPDKFRGTLTAPEAAAAIAAGARAAGAGCTRLPLADGGEGTLDAFGGPNRHARVTGPLGDPVEAGWRLGSGGTAVVEMARAAGLELSGGSGGNDPMAAGTSGVGELVVAALRAGARRLLIGLGGSATTDGGLEAVAALEEAGMVERFRRTEVLVCCDVRTLFRDAAAVFGPQKGASPQEVRQLAHRLDRAAEHYRQRYGRDIAQLPGAGAAGGLAGGLAALGARLVPGFEVIAAEAGLSAALDGVDLVITGEGELGAGSFDGKVVGGVTAAARERGLPALAVVGRADPACTGVEAVSLSDEFGPEESWTRTADCVREAVTAHLLREVIEA